MVSTVMVVTAAMEATQPAQGGLRPMDPSRDLGTIAGLIADAFASDIDERGRAALREMQWMARLSPLVWWMAQADPTFSDTFNGFVWEEDLPKGKGQQIVGNVSLNRAPGNRRRWIICNVVVQEAYRGRGIARQLMNASVAEARALGAEGVVLQVHQDNAPALRLYTDMGFREVAAETDWRLDAAPSVAFLDAPGYHFRPWKPADGQAVYDLARQVIPGVQQWLRPVRSQEYRPDWLVRLGQRISGLLSGRRVYHLTTLRGERLVATMTVTVGARQEDHRLALLVHPDHASQVEAALISRALYMLDALPSRPVRITVDASQAATPKALQAYGFKAQRTLLTLQKDF